MLALPQLRAVQSQHPGFLIQSHPVISSITWTNFFQLGLKLIFPPLAWGVESHHLSAHLNLDLCGYFRASTAWFLLLTWAWLRPFLLPYFRFLCWQVSQLFPGQAYGPRNWGLQDMKCCRFQGSLSELWMKFQELGIPGGLTSLVLHCVHILTAMRAKDEPVGTGSAGSLWQVVPLSWESRHNPSLDRGLYSCVFFSLSHDSRSSVSAWLLQCFLPLGISGHWESSSSVSNTSMLEKLYITLTHQIR